MKTYKKVLIIALAIICYCIVMYLGFKITGNLDESKLIFSDIYIKYDYESFEEYLGRIFNITEAIDKYDKVIMAIEMYYQDHNAYPSELEVLVPVYIDKVPGIYIKKGDDLEYSPYEKLSFIEGPPFSFAVSGNYPAPAFMHGWTLYYCPIQFDGCNVDHEDVTRIDNNWIWIHSSAF